jgi:hypothetical protein
MAKAAADQEAAVREAEAEQIKINAARDVSLRRAETETQTAAAEARAAQAGPLAEAEATQEVVRKQTELAQLEADRKQQELVASTVRPAEAEAEAQIRRAEGAKGAAIAQAQGDAERVKLAGEAQARVVEVTAEATAKQTTLEGNAEAGIVLSKGEAEAKALALRAEAYRQFNEAAIIQTVLSMLPDIVRAAAEPMGNIDSLTVLSNDGASDVVKNVTRTVTEASTTVKGLTGIDIPDLLNQALGTASDEPSGPSGSGGTKPKPSTPPRSGGGGSAPSGGPSGPSGPTGPTAASGGGGSTTAASSAGARASATGAATAAAGAATTVPPRFETQEAIDEALADVDRTLRAAAATTTPRTDTAAGPARPAQAIGTSRPESLDISRETTVDDAARKLAADLRSVPGIARFADVHLEQLSTTGPRPLRTMWRVARDQVDARVGQMTIGEVLDRYGDAGTRG